MSRCIRTWFLSLLFVVAIPHVPAQQCQTYSPTLAQATNDLCGPFVTDQIWSPVALPIAQTAISAQLNSTISGFRSFLPVIPLSCLNSLIALSCNSAFQPCQDVFVPELNRTAPISFPPCRSLCETVNQVCAQFYANYNHTPVNCSQDSRFPGQKEQYPVDTQETTVNGVVVTTQCYTSDKFPDPTVVWNVTDCPFPLNRAPVPTNAKPFSTTASTGICSRPCPTPFWTIPQWEHIARVMLAFATISFVLIFLLSVHYVVDPSCRKTTMRFQLYSFLCQMIFSLGWMMGGTHPIEMWCANPTTPATIHHTRCGAQAIFIVYGGLSQSIWWAISAGCLYFRLGTGVLRISWLQEAIFHLTAFGIPAIFTIVAARLDVLNGSPAAPICFVVGKVPNSNLDYHYVLFYIPMCAAMMIAMVFLIMSSIKLFYHTKMMRKTFKEHEVQAQLSLTQVNIRLFIWCLALFLIFFTFVIYRAVTQSEQDFFQNDLTAWAVCRIKFELGIDTNINCPSKIYPHPISFSGSVVHYVIVPSVGLFSFLALGLSKHIFIFWRTLFRLLREKKYDDVIILLTNEKALSKMSSSQSSHEEKRISDKTPMTASVSNSIQIPPPNNSSEISDIEMTVTSNATPTE